MKNINKKESGITVEGIDSGVSCWKSFFTKNFLEADSSSFLKRLKSIMVSLSVLYYFCVDFIWKGLKFFRYLSGVSKCFLLINIIGMIATHSDMCKYTVWHGARFVEWIFPTLQSEKFVNLDDLQQLWRLPEN